MNVCCTLVSFPCAPVSRTGHWVYNPCGARGHECLASGNSVHLQITAGFSVQLRWRGPCERGTPEVIPVQYNVFSYPSIHHGILKLLLQIKCTKSIVSSGDEHETHEGTALSLIQWKTDKNSEHCENLNIVATLSIWETGVKQWYTLDSCTHNSIYI